MNIYANLSGLSNVAAYENAADYIVVQFKSPNKDGSRNYKYTNSSAGSINIEEMKRRAVAGIGLNSFIMKNVKDLYEGKW